MKYKILITEDIDDEWKDYLIKSGYEIKLASDVSETTLIREVEDCHAILVRMANITKNIIQAGVKLKVISKFGVGIDNIDIDEATKLGIQVTNTPDSNKNAVAEYTMGLIIALAKNFFQYDRELRCGNFQIRNILNIDLEGKVLGIIGMGNIGKVVASKASKGFNMKVIGYKRQINEIDQMENIELTDNLEYLLQKCDFVSIHIPSNDKTKKLIGKKELSLMKPGSFFINTARGEVVDNEALVEALLNKKIAGAAVDVFEGEVPEKDNPLFKLENVIATPHTAAQTKESIRRMSLQSTTGVHEVLSGKKVSWPVNIV